MNLSIKPRRWLLIFHLLFCAIMFGNMVTFLLLSIAASSTEDSNLMEACYQIMHLLSETSVRASTFATIITGVLLSVWTKWGLFKYYWILAKEGLTLLLFGLNVWAMEAWTNRALTKVTSTTFPTTSAIVQLDLWVGIILQLFTLILIFAISVFKPWGRRRQKHSKYQYMN
ncbi:hypothetical protein [Thalassobacillus pellis]|uniref:hypothetical protein n=1 Tax=Thalassobacillus pellis TaxID=748008 RepID=UPI0019610248|nr:hypothetical protein [Thalassobacillus pellis]MBM7553354.1 putative membrane protein [Thalassobacillus pellis]